MRKQIEAYLLGTGSEGQWVYNDIDRERDKWELGRVHKNVLHPKLIGTYEEVRSLAQALNAKRATERTTTNG